MCVALQAVSRLKSTLYQLQYSVEMLSILRDGLNEPSTHLALEVWREVSELVLAREVERMTDAIDDVSRYLADTTRREVFSCPK